MKKSFWDGDRWVDETPEATPAAPSAARKVTRHLVGRVSEAAVIVGIVGALAFGSALFVGHPAGGGLTLAARGGSAKISGVAITAPDGVFGGTTTATVTGASGLWVRASCSATSGGAMVTTVQTDSSGQATIQLGPTPTWMSGGASCTAQAGTFNSRAQFVSSASTTFSVSG